MLGRRARRAALVEQQRGLCFYCDVPFGPSGTQHPRMATIDHVIPRPEGGVIEPENEVAACHQCNRLKGCMTVEQIRLLADRIEQAQRKAKP